MTLFGYKKVVLNKETQRWQYDIPMEWAYREMSSVVSHHKIETETRPKRDRKGEKLMQHLLQHGMYWYTNWYLDDPRGNVVSPYIWFKVYTPRQMDRLYDPDILGEFVNGGLGLSFSSILKGPKTDEHILPLETVRALGNIIWAIGKREANTQRNDKYGHQGDRHLENIDKYVTFTPSGGYVNVYVGVWSFPTAQLPPAVSTGQRNSCPHGVMGFAVSTHRRPTLRNCLTVPIRQGRQMGKDLLTLSDANLQQHRHM